MQPKHILRLFAAAALLALGLPLQSDAQSCSAAQCLANSAVIQKVQPTGVTNDDKGDVSFFSSQSGLPSVVFVLDNSTSMYELPYTKLIAFPNAGWAADASLNPDGTVGTPAAATLSDVASCKSSPYFDSLRDDKGQPYSKSKNPPYPPPDPAFNGTTDPKKIFFDPAKVYRYLEWNTSSSGGSDNGTTNGTSTVPALACQGSGISKAPDSGGPGLTQQQRCQQCIDEVGYYLKPAKPPPTPGGAGSQPQVFSIGAPITLISNIGPGSLATGTYFYVVTALLGTAPNFTETGPQNEVTATVGSNGKITITFGSIPDTTKLPPFPPATTYRIYRGTTAGGESGYFEVSPASFPATFPDTGGSFTKSNVAPPSMFVGSYVFKGSWLNFNPPKFVLARKVLTDFITSQTDSTAPARITVATYDPEGIFPNDTLCSGSLASGDKTASTCPANQPVTASGLRRGDGGHLLKTGMSPPCGKTTWRDPATKTARDALVTSVQALDFGTAVFKQFTPLAETLFNVGQFLSGDDSVYLQKFVSSNWLKTEFSAPSASDPARPRCVACQANAVVLITDGSPQGDNNVPQKMRDDAVTLCGSTPKTTCDFDPTATSTAAPLGSLNTLPAVASMLANTDPAAPTAPPPAAGTQLSRPIAITHVIALGVSQANLPPVLRMAAAQGLGQAFAATNSNELSQKLAEAVATVSTRGTAFSSAALSSLQIGGNGSAVYVPRFNPSAQSTPIWKGQLLRFNIFNEFSNGAHHPEITGNGPLDGVFIVDKPATPGGIGNIVVEDDKGNFVKQKDGTAAKPLWDAGDVLQKTAFASRKVFTAIACSPPSATCSVGGWQTITFTDTDSTAVANIAPALGLTDAICGQIQGKMVPSPTGTFNAASTACQTAVIQWALGKDLFASTPPPTPPPPPGTPPPVNRTPMLGDIFHGSPITVDPPVDQFLCQTGLHTQCLSTLFGYRSFAQQSSNVAQTPASKDASGTTIDAYEGYWQAHKTRQRIVMVGANDGMVHAFKAGTATSTTPTNDVGFRQIAYDDGDGTETWGFIPPDQLPRLAQMMVNGHQFSLDGDIMVRDVWVDGQGNDKAQGYSDLPFEKQAEEFHTVAVVSERQGGNHFVGLDVTDTQSPKMLWMYPPPCSPDEQVFGQSWAQHAPHAPPIGPVLLQTDKPKGQSRLGFPLTEERWAVFLNGGHSPWNTRGRAVAMLDVFTGSPLFKATFKATDDAQGPSSAMRFGFSAPVAMVDYNTGDLSATDGFFDTAVVGDEGGQLWTFHFLDPGHKDSTTGLVDNWVYGRAFEPDTSADPRTHQPIYGIASTTVQPNTQTLRAFFGTGDRSHLRSTGGGDCRPDDPASCVASGCNVSSSMTIDNGPNHYTSTYSSVAGSTSSTPAVDKPTQDVSPLLTPKLCTSALVTESMNVTSCPAASTEFSETLTFSCSGSPSICSDGVFPAPTPNTNRGATTGQTNFFAGISVLTSPVGAPIVARKLNGLNNPNNVDTNATPSVYDGARITLADTNLKDVTALGATTSGITGGTGATRDGSGWVFKYNNVDEKTATGATMINSCVVWSSLAPSSNAVTCGTIGSSSRTFQADAFTGAPNCAQTFLDPATSTYARFTPAREVLSPPPDAAPAISVGPGNRSVRYSMLQIQPANKASDVNRIDFGTSSDLLKLISSVPLTADQHACRHGTDLSKCP